MSKEIVNEFEAGERLDKALAKMYPQYSRSVIEKLITSGDILVNNNIVKTKYLLKKTDIITADFSQLEAEPQQIDLPIIYEDENVVVINKPIGILAHTKGAFSKEGTVATWLQDHISEASALRARKAEKDGVISNRAGIVHRLDRGTSGVMICAKNEETQRFLQKQFSNRNVKKTYVAVVAGLLPEEQGLIDVPIERNPKKPATFRPGANGKSAQTHFKTLQTTNYKLQTFSLVELKPRTGRTHQLRVHLNYLKHPIVGDEFYGGEPAERLMLHAKELEITLPGGNRQTFSAPVPRSFKEYM